MNAIIHPIEEHVYRASDGVSQSALKWMEQTPAHFYYAITHPTEPTPAMELGTLVDHLVFGTALRWALSPYDEFRNKESKEWRDAQRDARVMIVTQARLELANAMVESIRRRPVVQGFLQDGGQAQVAAYAMLQPSDESLQPMQCKGLIDYLPKSTFSVVDLKTTTDASPDAFSRHALSLGYDVQAAIYLDLLAANGQEGLDWYWIVVESAPPHEVATYQAPPDLIARGRARYRHYLSRLARCIETDSWPGYPDQIQMMPVPNWALK